MKRKLLAFLSFLILSISVICLSACENDNINVVDDNIIVSSICIDNVEAGCFIDDFNLSDYKIKATMSDNSEKRNCIR